MANQEYHTVRDLERSNAKWFKSAGITGLVGIVLIFFGLVSSFMTLLGIACVIGAAIVCLVAMIRVIQVSKQPVRHIYCPYCASKNDVFISKTELPCDICGRRIGITPYGEPIPLEPMEDDED